MSILTVGDLKKLLDKFEDGCIVCIENIEGIQHIINSVKLDTCLAFRTCLFSELKVKNGRKRGQTIVWHNQ